MNPVRDSLLHQLDDSIALFTKLRTPDATCVAAFDALKQARALVARAIAGEGRFPAQGMASDARCALAGAEQG